MKKLVLILMVLVALGIAGCKKKEASGGEQQTRDSGGVKIALMMRNLDEQFLKDYRDYAVKFAAEKGFELNVQDARKDSATQLTQVETLLNQGFKYFVIIPNEGELADQMNRLIHAKGGAAAYSNTPPTTSSLKVGPNFFFASSPEKVAGVYQGQIIADYFDKYPDKAPGKVVNMLLINGQMGHPAQFNRTDGLLEEIRNRGYTVNIVAEGSADWAPDRAQELMTAWIAAFRGRFNVVAANNDGMALGAVQALIQAGMTKADTNDGIRLAVPVLGVDATGDALASMSRNELFATVLQSAVGQASTAFDVIYQVASGSYKAGNPAGGIPAATSVISEYPANDASVIGQCYLVPFVPVDKASDYYKANAPR